MPTQSRTVSLGPRARTVRAENGEVLTVPDGWALLPPGDPGLTRRAKAGGPCWTVVEKRGRKTFSQGVWVPEERIEAARAALDAERATPAYARRLERDRERRERDQAAYAGDFEVEVRLFLGFHARHADLEARLAAAVAAHATPVGSGTVARTQRIPIEERAEAAVIAWMRHQTTAYDDMQIARVKGRRREVRRDLARRSRQVLDRYRGSAEPPADCPLARALAPAPQTPPPAPDAPPSPVEGRPAAASTHPSSSVLGSQPAARWPAPPILRPRGGWTRQE